MDLALDFYRNRIAEANKLSSSTTKWGDMKLSDLEKEQAENKVNQVTNVPKIWKHQTHMYGDCQGMLVVMDTVELSMFIKKGAQLCKATMEQAEWAVPELKVTVEEMALHVMS